MSTNPANPHRSKKSISTTSHEPPQHLDSQHPNPAPWRPSSHFPNKPPLDNPPKNRRPSKANSDPFIDRFIEEIADLVGGQGGVDAAVLSSMEYAARTSNSSSFSNPAVAAMARSLNPNNPLAAANQSSDDRKTQVMSQLYEIFSKVSNADSKHSGIKTHSYLRQSLPRSYNPPPPKQSSSEPQVRPKFTTNTKYTPSNQYTPKRNSSQNNSSSSHLPPPVSLHTPMASTFGSLPTADSCSAKR